MDEAPAVPASNHDSTYIETVTNFLPTPPTAPPSVGAPHNMVSHSDGDTSYHDIIH